MSKIRQVERILRRNLSKEAAVAHYSLLHRFCMCFGFLAGVRLFVQFKLRKVDRLRIPGIRFPVSLRPGTSDIAAFNHIFLDNNYWMDFPEYPGTIIDGGANVGLFSVKVKNKYPHVRIVCIEPDPDNFSQLKKNLSLYGNVFFEHSALWGRNGMGAVHNKFNMGQWGMVVYEDQMSGTIPLITMSAIFGKYRINGWIVVKLDIETSEKQVFSSNVADWLPRVNILMIELHDWLEPGCCQVFFHSLDRTMKEYCCLIKGDTTVIINAER